MVCSIDDIYFSDKNTMILHCGMSSKKEPTKQMAIRFPISLYEKIKRYSDNRIYSFSESVIEICESVLNRGENVCSCCYFENPIGAKICRNCMSKLQNFPIHFNDAIKEYDEVIKYHEEQIKITNVMKSICELGLEGNNSEILNEKLNRLIDTNNSSVKKSE